MNASETAIHNQGIIRYMAIPPGWIEVQVETFDTSQLRFFHPLDNLEAKLCFFYRGLPTSTDAGKVFASLLTQSPHHLNADEIKALFSTLGESGNNLAFNLLAARTENLNGKPVLIVEGNWHRSNLDSYDVFIDVDGTGRIVQEVYLLAAHDVYQQYLPQVKGCLATIEWYESTHIST